jgi:tetratricopeptide (TPR) repeat protein
VPVDSFALGNEQVQHTRLRIGGIELRDVDMLLGVDFFLSHRVFVSNSLRKIYFTYSGGPVFRLDQASVAQLAKTAPAAQDAAPTPSAAQAAPNTVADLNGPVDAAGFARRAAAEVSRLDYVHAIADFDRAVAMDPTNAKTVYDRAMAHAANRQTLLAVADLDEAIKLKPDDAEALRARAGMFLSGGDRTRGRADLEAAAKAATDDPALSLAIDLMFERAGLLQEGVEQLDRWLVANPKANPDQKAVALNGRCWFRAVLKTGLDQALADCDAALKLEPRTAGFFDSRGHVRLDRGEYDLAITDYDAALRENPKLAAALYGRGLAKLKKGMKPEGDADIQAALAINPRLAQQAPRMGLDKPADTAPAG